MNGIKGFVASTTNTASANSINWQDEIKQLHGNFIVINKILSQAVGLSHATVNRYTSLQQHIAETMENLLDDLDKIEQVSAHKTSQVLSRHATVIKKLNNRVYALIQDATA